jgi:hypothetical protein
MTNELANRVERLERSLRWVVCGWILSIVLLVLLFLATPKALTAPPSDRFTVRSLAVTDDKGVERIRIAAPLPDAVVQGKVSKRRSPANGIQLNDARGNERGALSMLDDGSLILCFDTNASEAACMYVMPSGERGFSITDDKWKDRAELVLSPEKEVRLVLNDDAGKTRANVRVDVHGVPSVQLGDAQGKVTWSTP